MEIVWLLYLRDMKLFFVYDFIKVYTSNDSLFYYTNRKILVICFLNYNITLE